MAKRAILLTGPPGCGKTTLIRRVIEELGLRAGGFYTEEVRVGGVRRGFRIVCLDGPSGTLAAVDLQSPYRVGKYGVSLSGIDTIAVPAIYRALAGADVVVIDEIGKMELFSPRFQEAVVAALDSGKVVLGTIMLAPHPWADGIKGRPEVALIPLRRGAWAEARERLLALLRALTP